MGQSESLLQGSRIERCDCQIFQAHEHEPLLVHRPLRRGYGFGHWCFTTLLLTMQRNVWRRQAVYRRALYSDNLWNAIPRSQGIGRPHQGTAPRQKALTRGIELPFRTPSHRIITNRTRATRPKTVNTAESGRERTRN